MFIENKEGEVRRMDIIKKYIYEAVALTVLISIIAMGITIFHYVKNANQSVQIQMDETTRRLMEAKITLYANKGPVPGGTIRGYIEEIIELDGITITIVEGTEHYGIDPEKVLETRKEKINGAPNPRYISPQKDYEVTIDRDPATNNIKTVFITETE